MNYIKKQIILTDCRYNCIKRRNNKFINRTNFRKRNYNNREKKIKV